jgi:hypothetical protein
MAMFIPAALVYSGVIGLGFLIGSSMMFAPGICFIAAAGLVVPAGVMESRGTVSALGRGLALASKVFGRALLVVLGSAALMIVVLVMRPIGLLRSMFDNTTVVLALSLAWLYIPGLLVLIFANICFTLLYLDACASELAVRTQAQK